MQKSSSLTYHKIKAVIVLLCLGFMVVGTCPIQKLILSASPIEVEFSKQSSTSTLFVKHNPTCSYNKEIVKTPLVVELTKKSNNNALFFAFLSTIASLLMSFVVKESIPVAKKRVLLISPVPLFLKNQVFRI